MSKHSKSSTIYCLFLFCLSLITPSLCVNNDAASLLAFKAYISNDPLQALTSWNQTVHVCSWRGITCSLRHANRVVSINLMSQKLVGPLSPHLFNLSFLRSITLRNNSFHGPITNEIGRLRRLEYVELSNNSFSGEIPRNLSQCTNLYYLNLIDNNLGTSFPSELGSLSKLQALGLSRNRLSATIPPSIGNLTSLNRLSLADCGLEGRIPESLVNLKSLRLLQLSQNRLTGTLPPGLFNISTISVFSLRSNRLQGTLPNDLAFTLPNIMDLDIGGNMFSGQIPDSLSNASSLEGINLSLNNFTGPIMSNFENLPNLEYFYLSSNYLSSDLSFISSLTNCTKLRVIAVSENLLNGSLPESIANLSSHLFFISLASNHIHGTIPFGIQYLLNVGYLNLRNNHMSGPIPSSIGNLVNLHELYLEANRFTNNIPTSIGNLTLLNDLYLGHNTLSGALPISIGNCRSLLAFDVSHNNLSGSIPLEILSLSSISISFNLAYNEFSGSIPSQIGLLRNLQDLDLSNNMLSGSIPGSLSSCVRLQRLYLNGNSFDGEIPRGLSALRGLLELDLSRNRLSGSIPSFLSDLRLLNLNLSFNMLTGEVPLSGVFRNITAVSVDGNNGLCGGIVQLRLNPCSSSNPKKKKIPKILLLIIILISSVFLIALISLYVFLRRKGTRISRGPLSWSFKGFPLRLSYADLLKATCGFSEANLVGSGRYGSVYKGVLDDIGKTTVAVKVLKLDVRGASKSFMAECKTLKGVRHRNLVKLLSICDGSDFKGQDFKALIYEFESNGCLEEWLHHDSSVEERTRCLTFIERLNIAIDIACALEYLHFGNDFSVIHGDIKPSNVLLDGDMTAHVGDFGLAKVVSNLSEESTSTAIRGTIGYIPPEYGMGGRFSTEGDAYSYGILVLEMFTNIRPTNDALKNNHNLHNFISNSLPVKAVDIIDPEIVQCLETDNVKIKECMMFILSIGVACSKELPMDRMAMTEVVTQLKQAKAMYLAERMS